jgi:aminoglycoside phosphotransferase (APT) family kinase protein
MTSTHELSVSGRLLTKRFASWDRGEQRREWSVLRHVAAYRPDLVPEPVEADLDAVPPWVTMTLLPGEPLAGRLDSARMEALGTAIEELWSVPVAGLDLPRVDCLRFARRLTDGPRPDGAEEARAYDAALDWWRGSDPGLLAAAPGTTVIGHGDANLANYLWDGRRIRIVDFEDAGWSDPATEVAILLEHASARRTDVEALSARFAVDPIRLRAARRAWAMFWLWLMLPGGPSARRNPPGAAAEQATRLLGQLRT